MVSKARGKNRWVLEISTYFDPLRCAADSAAVEEDVGKYEAATVLVTVTSHVTLWSWRHGIKVSPWDVSRQAGESVVSS